MASDVQAITGTRALIGARLSNFPTATSNLLPSHLAWLDTQAIPLVKTKIAPWIDIIGYASRKGDVAFNQRLSFQRCEAVKNHILARLRHAEFNVENAKGASESLGDAKNDDGYWRAVEVYVFGFQPPDPIAKPTPTPPGSRNFKIRVVSGGSLTIPDIDGPQGDSYNFQIVDVARRLQSLYEYKGGGLALPVIVPIFFSVTTKGPFSDFTTSRGESLSSFVGDAQLFGDPGVTFGKHSKGGVMRLSLRSRTLVTHVTLVHPSLIPIEGGLGIGLSAGSATSGTLSMLSSPAPFIGSL